MEVRVKPVSQERTQLGGRVRKCKKKKKKKLEIVFDKTKKKKNETKQKKRNPLPPVKNIRQSHRVANGAFTNESAVKNRRGVTHAR